MQLLVQSQFNTELLHCSEIGFFPQVFKTSIAQGRKNTNDCYRNHQFKQGKTTRSTHIKHRRSIRMHTSMVQALLKHHPLGRVLRKGGVTKFAKGMLKLMGLDSLCQLCCFANVAGRGHGQQAGFFGLG